MARCPVQVEAWLMGGQDLGGVYLISLAEMAWVQRTKIAILRCRRNLQESRPLRFRLHFLLRYLRHYFAQGCHQACPL